MVNEIKLPTSSIKILACDEIIHVHHLLSNHEEILNLNPEPIQPSGIKDLNLLESAISRQQTSLGEIYKYDNIFSNCASLIYGITCNHAFHNGNKRAALLCMMLHLHRNGYIIDPYLKHEELYEFLRRIAGHKLSEYREVREYRGYFKSTKIKNGTLSDGQEMNFIEHWIRRNSVAKENVSKPIKWNLLRKILTSFQIEVNIESSDKKITLRKRIKSRSFLFKDKILEHSYPDNGTFCYPRTLKQIRQDFCLQKDDGIDDNSFKTSEDVYLDEIITVYKKVIYKLSLT